MGGGFRVKACDDLDCNRGMSNCAASSSSRSLCTRRHRTSEVSLFKIACDYDYDDAYDCDECNFHERSSTI